MKCYKITDVFEIIGPGPIKRVSDEVAGKTPMVSSTEFNNGVIGNYDVPPVYNNCFTLSQVGGKLFYHDYKFTATCTVFVLRLKWEMTLYQKLALITMVNKQLEKRFTFLNKLSRTKLERLEIKLIDMTE